MQPRPIPSPAALSLLRSLTYTFVSPIPKHRFFHATSIAPQQPNGPLPSKPAQQITVRTRPERPHIRAYDGELQPKPLSRPLGLPSPPQPGENTGVDTRTLRQRRDDYVSYDKHTERRKYLIKELYTKNYFRDIGNLGKIHKGKSIVAPTTPFKAAIARWFPNLRGRTLVKGHAGRDADTTRVLRGKISVVSLVNTEWARSQCQTFVGAEDDQNPALERYLSSEEAKGLAQMVEINVEPNWLKATLIRLFMYRLRRVWAREHWGQYFLITRGMDDDIKEALAVWNAKVGYVYLVDRDCKVRWAGNGPAREEEKRSLINSLQRLVEEAKGTRRAMSRPTPKIATALDPEQWQKAAAIAT